MGSYRQISAIQKPDSQENELTPLHSQQMPALSKYSFTLHFVKELLMDEDATAS